jgi:hypothetical protein
MASLTASAGEINSVQLPRQEEKSRIFGAIVRLTDWLERNDYRGYDTFDGLNARLLRPFTFETKLLRTVLQQGVRRFPLNMRGVLGVSKERSTKGMGFLAQGFIRLHAVTAEQVWADKARMALEWLMEHRLPEYSGACWGNHFDYQSRAFFLPKGVPTIVWTSLIGHAFLDGYEHFKEKDYLSIAVSACEHITGDLGIFPEGDGACISYIPGQKSLVHNANTLGASLLARTFQFTKDQAFLTLAQKSIRYTAQHQRPDGSWYYGEREDLRWVDNFHTGYVLDCFKYYAQSSRDDEFTANMLKGYGYWKANFFLPNGAPRYYSHKTLPFDIQCCSQAIDTLIFFQDYDPESVGLALKVAAWTIDNMQDETGYFYYRRYSRHLANKTATLHWGQATMLRALAGLYRSL